MLNHREIAQHAALCSERCRCLSYIGAAAVIAAVFAALAFVWPAYWTPLAIVAAADAFVAALWTWRLARVTRRIEQLEKFL